MDAEDPGLIDSTLSASILDSKKSCCLPMEASVKEINPSLWRSFQDQSYQIITHYIDQSVLSYVLTTGPSSQASQMPTVARVTSPELPAASGSWLNPTNLSQYSLTNLVNVSFNLSGGATALSVTNYPTGGEPATFCVVFYFRILKAQKTVDCGTKLRVIGDDT